MHGDDGSVEEKVQEFLLKYRSTSNVSGRSPAEVMFRRKIRTKLDFLVPFAEAHSGKQDLVSQQDSHFKIGENVWVRYYSGIPRWRHGQILKR